MAADSSNTPADREIGTRLRMMADCMIRLTASLNEASPEIQWLAPTDRGEDMGQDGVAAALLPITRFHTEEEANEVWEKASQSLVEFNTGPPNTWHEIDGIFEELALNAAQHSLSPEGSSATLECFSGDDETVFLVGIADAGIGIPSSLRRNPEHRPIPDDEVAILRATEMDVTGTLEPRGIGLYHVTERVRAYRGELAIISGAGFLMVRSGEPPVLGNLEDLGKPSYPGTIAIASIPIPSD